MAKEPNVLDVPLDGPLDADADHYNSNLPTMRVAQNVNHSTPGVVRARSDSDNAYVLAYDLHTVAALRSGAFFGISEEDDGSSHGPGTVFRETVDSGSDDLVASETEHGVSGRVMPVEIKGESTGLANMGTMPAYCAFIDDDSVNCHMYAWWTRRVGAGAGTLDYRIVDADTGAVYKHGTLVLNDVPWDTGAGDARLQMMWTGTAGSVIVAWIETTGQWSIRAAVYDVGTHTFGSAATLHSDTDLTGFGLHPDPDDVTHFYICFWDSNLGSGNGGMRVQWYDDTLNMQAEGGYGHSTGSRPFEDYAGHGIHVNGTKLWCAWDIKGGGTSYTYLAVFTRSSLTVDAFSENLWSLDAGSLTPAQQFVRTTITSNPDDDNQALIASYRGVLGASTLGPGHTHGDPSENVVHWATLNLSGATLTFGDQGVVHNADLVSHAFQLNGMMSFAMSVGQGDASMLLVSHDDERRLNPVARYGYGRTMYQRRPISMHVANVRWTALPWDTTQIAGHYLSGQRPNSDVASDALEAWNVHRVLLDLEPKPMRVLERNNSLEVFGGLPMTVDGAEVVETQPHCRPVITVAEVSGAGWGNAQTHLFKVVFTWFDNAGVKHRSRPSDPATLTTTGVTKVEVEIIAPTMPLRDGETQRRLTGADVEVYATVDAGTEYHLLDTTGATLTKGTDDDGVWVYDFVVEPTGDEPLLYTDGGVRAAEAAPALLDAAHVRDRTWAVDAENRVQVWASLPHAYFVATEWTGTQIFQIPGGECTAAAELLGQPIIFQRNAIWTVYGDGPSATGQGSPWSQPVRLSSVGAIDRGAVITTEVGVFFESPDGIMLLGTDMTVSHVGRPVRSETVGVRRAVDVPIEGAVWFIQGASATSLIYNYRTGRWSTCSHNGNDAVLRGDEILLVDNTIIRRVMADPDDFSLDPATSILETPWIRPAGEQGSVVFNDVIAALEHFNNGDASVEVQIWLDYSQAAHAWVKTVVGSTDGATHGHYDLSMAIADQVRSIKLRLDISPDAGGEAAELVRARAVTLIYGVQAPPHRRLVQASLVAVVPTEPS